MTRFDNIPNKNIAIFLPHCLRHKDCPAENKGEGYDCVDCGRCGIGKFAKDAKAAGYKIFIVPGASMVKKIIKKNDFKVVIGVACKVELKQAEEMLKNTRIITASVPLKKDGCVNTEVGWDELRKVCNI